LCYAGCHAGHSMRLLSDDSDDSETKPNVTLATDNVCLKAVVQEGNYNYYNLDFSSCYDDIGFSYVSLEARITKMCNSSQQWSLLVNTKGDLPEIEDTNDPDEETYMDLTDSDQPRYYTHLDLPLEGNTSIPWFAGVYSSCGPVQYTLKAWCSISKGCNLSCSDPDSGPCVSLETCRCVKEADEATCDIDVDQLPDEEDIITRNGLTLFHDDETLGYGRWKYFQFQVVDNDSRIMVEMARVYGDVILFLKPQGVNGTVDLPTETDANTYSDIIDWQNRLSNHHVFATGPGIYYIGVFNTDHCVEEETTFNLTITIATPKHPMNLCPMNCSYPRGVCVRDNHCECQPGYGGNFCGASLWPAAPKKSYSGQLKPGQWAYVNLVRSQLTDSGDVSIKFSARSGHSILMAQQSGYPTLTDSYVKFSDENLNATSSSIYYINGSLLENGNVILGVFNVDYQHQGISDFEIIILGVVKGLSIWIILALALGSSVVVLLAMGTFRYVMQSRGEQDGLDPENLDFEATPQGTEMVVMRPPNRALVSSLPLLTYQEGLLPVEEAGCSICLNNYSIAELLCRLPDCKHIFHVKCIDGWFQTDTSCPLCRGTLQANLLMSQNRAAQGPDTLSPDLQPSTSNLGNTPQFSGLHVDQQASSSGSSGVNFRAEKPAPISTNDYQPLLLKGGSSSSESSSRSDNDLAQAHNQPL